MKLAIQHCYILISHVCMTARTRLENVGAKRLCRDWLASANERRYYFVSAIQAARCVSQRSRSNDSQKAITAGFKRAGLETQPEKRFHEQLKCLIDGRIRSEKEFRIFPSLIHHDFFYSFVY